MSPFLLEVGMIATLGFGMDAQRLQDTQCPYFLIEKPIDERFTAILKADSIVYDQKTLSTALQLGLETRKAGLNYGVGVLDERDMGLRTTKVGQVLYIKLSYKWGY